MKTAFKFIPVIALALGSTAALANPAPHSDANQARQDTVKTRTVNYSCQGGKKSLSNTALTDRICQLTLKQL